MTLTLASGLTPGPGDRLLITLQQGTGLLTPQAPRGFDERDEPYPVQVTFLDGSEDGPLPPYRAQEHHFIAVRNPVSSTVPGATVRVELHTRAESALHGNEDIVVDFAGPTADTSFTLPESIDEKNVTVDWAGKSPKIATTVLVQGGKVIITVPQDDNEPTEITGNYVIAFKERAKIRNPLAAGNRIISVYPASRPHQVHEIIAVIRRTTTTDPPKGPRGRPLTLEGKGYADGTVTIFDGDDENIGAGEMLGFANTEKGAFTLELTARGKPGSPHYRIWTLDGNGVYHSVDFPIESAMSFDPERVRSGEDLAVTVIDWQQEHPALAAVTIGGETAYAATAVEYENCFDIAEQDRRAPDQAGILTVRLQVPTTLPPGRRNVAVFGPAHLRMVTRNGATSQKPHCLALAGDGTKGDPVSTPKGELIVAVSHDPVASRPIEIVGRALRVVPRTGVRGQRVTIIGSGIDRLTGKGRDIRQISIGGTDVPEDPAGFEVPAKGEYALDVTVPADALTGTNEVRVQGTNGNVAHGTIIVAPATLEVTPGGGRQGAPFTVHGTGFVADRLISLYYGDGGDLRNGEELLKVLIADRKGAFTAEAAVPWTAELGVRYIVTAVADTGGDLADGPVRASHNHTVSAGRVAADADTACPGDTVTVTGQNLPPFSIVNRITLGGVQLSTAGTVHTDKDGNFNAEVRVPHLEQGNQTMQILVANTVYVDVIEIVGAPLSGPPQRVFKDLIRSGLLDRAWHYDNAGMKWSFYDPDPALAGFIDMRHVASGTIIILKVTQEIHFQGELLYPGWNFVLMK